MEKLIPNAHEEIENIARRLVIIQLEYPDHDMNGMLIAIRSIANNYILEIGKYAGENGKLWK